MLINIGYHLFTTINLELPIQEQAETAKREVETLSLTSEFNYQLAKVAGNLKKDITSLSKNYKKKDSYYFDNLNKLVSKSLAEPFPENDLFIFSTSLKEKTELIYSNNDTNIIKSAFTRSFEHLINLNKGKPRNKTNENFLGRIIGSEIDAKVISTSQRGKTSYCVYKGVPHYFLWDYFETHENETMGIMIFVENNNAASTAAKKLAIKNLSSNIKGFRAFIPLFSYGEEVLQSSLERSQLFKTWKKENIPELCKIPAKYGYSNAPNNFKLGKYTGFCHIDETKPYMSILLLPTIEANRTYRALLNLLNFILVGLILTIFFRGLFFNKWPNISLKVRFICGYLLVASLPIGLMFLSAYGYIAKYRNSAHIQKFSQLHECIKTFDNRKTQMANEYKETFSELINDKTFIHMLENEGPNSPSAQRYASEFFINRARPLPFMCIKLYNIDGVGFTEYYDSNKESADTNIDALTIFILKVLWEKNGIKENKNFKPSIIQELLQQMYSGSEQKYSFINQFERSMSSILTRDFNGTKLSYIIDLVKDVKVPKYALLVIWNEDLLDKSSFEDTLNYLGINHPKMSFDGFKVSPMGLSQIGGKQIRHITKDFASKAQQIAEQTAANGGTSTIKHKDYLITAVKANNYSNTILIGGTTFSDIDFAIEIKTLIFTLILFLSLFIVVICALISARYFISPTIKLNELLKKITRGKLDIEIENAGKDEIGLLSNEFSKMTAGLRDRKKLATLVSDQVLLDFSDQKLEKNYPFTGVALVSDIRNFTGTSEIYPAETITELLNEHFEQMARIISQYGGRIYKFIGDAIEAIFYEDNNYKASPSERAFQAANAMLEKLNEINKSREIRNLFQYKIGIGICKGEMYSGYVGNTNSRLDYAILGDAIKIAGKLESASVQNPDYPLTICRNTALDLREKNIKFLNAQGIDGFFINKTEKNNIKASKSANNPDLKPDLSTVSENIEKIVISSGYSSKTVAFIFFVIILLISIGLNYGKTAVKSAKSSLFKTEARMANKSIIEQIKYNSNDKYAFETYCRKTISKIENDRFANPPKLNDYFEKHIFLKNDLSKKSKTGTYYNLKTLTNKGFDKNAVNSLTKFANIMMYCYEKKAYDKNKNNKTSKIIRQNKLLNTREIIDYLPFAYPIKEAWDIYSAIFFRATFVTIEGIDFYMYPDFIVEDDVPQGVIICFEKTEKVKKDINYLISLASTEKCLAIAQGLNNEKIYSDNWTKELIAYYTANPSKFITNHDEFKFNKQNYKLSVLSKIENQSLKLDSKIYKAQVILWMTAVLIILMLLKSNSIIKKYIAFKIWGLILSAIIIPILTVYITSELHNNEIYNVKTSELKNNLSQTITLFEKRAYFGSDIIRHSISEGTKSQTISEIAKELNIKRDPVKEKKLQELFFEINNEYKKASKGFNNTIAIEEAVAVSKKKWTSKIQIKSLEKAAETKKNEFSSLLEKLGKKLMSTRLPSEDKLSKSNIEEETVGSTIIDSMRFLFGDDLYVKLLSAPEKPVALRISLNKLSFIFSYIPNFKTPEFLTVWLTSSIAKAPSNFSEKYNKKSKEKDIYKLYTRDYYSYPLMFVNELLKYRHSLLHATALSYLLGSPVNKKLDIGTPHIIEVRSGSIMPDYCVFATASTHKIEKEIQDIKMYINYALLASLILIIYVANGFTNDITRPVKFLTEGINQISIGNYSSRIYVKQNDEFGDLCSSFNIMAKGLEEKELMRRMISQKAQEDALGNKPKQPTTSECVLMYMGIPNFSKIISNKTPHETFNMLKNQIGMLADITIQEGGEVDKIIGEKILSVFYKTSPDSNPVTNACNAALKIKEARQNRLLPMNYAIGINHGKVISGFLGAGNKRDHTVIGDAVNTAARIQSYAELNAQDSLCLISKNAANLLSPNSYSLKKLGAVSLKGKENKIEVYKIC
ncbi:MAG: adenylate/guanylate cyclase domain-containing protein [Candidatus Riflebacteria bacterium]|nr:adenylate/guanylate cyclase domain-containing protein [Candidatus Riflebacteria bacterium]